MVAGIRDLHLSHGQFFSLGLSLDSPPGETSLEACPGDRGEGKFPTDEEVGTTSVLFCQGQGDLSKGQRNDLSGGPLNEQARVSAPSTEGAAKPQEIGETQARTPDQQMRDVPPVSGSQESHTGATSHHHLAGEKLVRLRAGSGMNVAAQDGKFQF
jgi:hypothetical protein